jgi:hypothetical protein
VLNAGLIVALSKDAPLAIFAEEYPGVQTVSLVAFAGLIALLYAWLLRRKEAW